MKMFQLNQLMFEVCSLRCCLTVDPQTNLILVKKGLKVHHKDVDFPGRMEINRLIPWQEEGWPGDLLWAGIWGSMLYCEADFSIGIVFMDKTVIFWKFLIYFGIFTTAAKSQLDFKSPSTARFWFIISAPVKVFNRDVKNNCLN